MIRRYGQVSDGGLIDHRFYSDQFIDDLEATASLIDSFADDPMMKAIVVNQAVPGTAEGFRRVKARRPDIICLAGEAHEEPE
ncbi:MAG: DUF3798 domain-containing protein [Deltaproteobacteria bacterium]|jgi:hypothetical protein|nr:DUF3798 domain-containing protein [Deltaproteobacteria bacterium]